MLAIEDTLPAVALKNETDAQAHMREAFRQDTLQAWQEYQQTGLHATSDEVTAWLQTWGTHQEMPTPTCHK